MKMKKGNKKSAIIASNRLKIALNKAEKKEPLTLKEHASIKRLVYALGGLVVVSCMSCGFNASFCQGNGCKMDADFATGVIAETKNPANEKSSYWQARENDTNRLTWMESLFGKRGQ
jgi:hypothetical protein